MDIPEHGLTKPVWTDADFDQMGWHDSHIHSFHDDSDDVTGRFEFVFDLDYLTRWVQEPPPAVNLSFWIAPATLVFHNAHMINIDLQTSGQITVQALRRSAPQYSPDGALAGYLWEFDLNEGSISLWATGFTQYFRRPPVYKGIQWFTLVERDGVSFAREMEHG